LKPELDFEDVFIDLNSATRAYKMPKTKNSKRKKAVKLNLNEKIIEEITKYSIDTLNIKKETYFIHIKIPLKIFSTYETK